MSRTRISSYHHLVWATKYRAPVIYGELESLLIKSMWESCAGLDAKPIAINAAWNHIHVLLSAGQQMPSYAEVVRDLKALSWRAYFEARAEGMKAPQNFLWQHGYSVTTLRGSEVPTVVRYIKHQKAHHQEPHTLIEHLELNDEHFEQEEQIVRRCAMRDADDRW